MTRIWNWIYGRKGFRENVYEPLSWKHRPSGECWHGYPQQFHTLHIPLENPDLRQLAALGNHLTDRVEWLFELIAKLSTNLNEIGNETLMKLDLINTITEGVDRQIPTNFSEAIQQLYVASYVKNPNEEILQHLEELRKEINSISLKVKAIELATGANLIPP